MCALIITLIDQEGHYRSLLPLEEGWLSSLKGPTTFVIRGVMNTKNMS